MIDNCRSARSVKRHYSLLALSERGKFGLGLTAGNGKDEERAIARHEVPEPMALYDHAQVIAENFPHGSKLFAEDIVDVPDPEPSGEGENAREERLDDLFPGRVGWW